MDIKEFTLSEKSLIGGGQGVVYNLKIVYPVPAVSAAYSVPEINVNSIGAVVDGLAVLYATLSPPADILDDTAIWEEWDGLSGFNNAITAFRVINPSGASTVILSVRGLL